MPTTITNPVDRQRYFLARLGTFRAWVGATTGEEEAKLAAALAKTYAHYANVADVTPPFAIVEDGDTEKFNRTGEGGGCFLGSHSVITTFFGADTSTDRATQITQMESFRASVRGIIDDLRANSGTGTYINWDDIDRKGRPQALQPSSKQAWFFVAYECSGRMWGSQSEA